MFERGLLYLFHEISSSENLFLTHLTIVTITRGEWNLFSYVNNHLFCSPWFSGLPISTVDNLAFCKRLISDQGLSENPVASLYEIVSETDAKRTDGHHLTFLLNTIIIVALASAEYIDHHHHRDPMYR